MASKSTTPKTAPKTATVLPTPLQRIQVQHSTQAQLVREVQDAWDNANREVSCLTGGEASGFAYLDAITRASALRDQYHHECGKLAGLGMAWSALAKAQEQATK
jgi:hypothetical protein